MRNLLIIFVLSVSSLVFAQGGEQFLFAYNEGNKTVNSENAILENTFDPDADLTFTEIINFYIAANLDDSGISGEGKSSTLLSLRFSEEGILENVTTIGENKVLNSSAENLFLPFIGKRFTAASGYCVAAEYNVPIVIKH